MEEPEEEEEEEEREDLPEQGPLTEVDQEVLSRAEDLARFKEEEELAKKRVNTDRARHRALVMWECDQSVEDITCTTGVSRRALYKTITKAKSRG